MDYGGDLRALPAAAFDRAEERDCSIPLPNGMEIAMDGLRFLRAWALPHFHYLSQVGAFIEKRTA